MNLCETLARRMQPVREVTEKEPWQMSYSELRTKLNPGTKEELKGMRHLLPKLYPEYVNETPEPNDDFHYNTHRAYHKGDQLPRIPFVDLSQRHRKSIEQAHKAGHTIPVEAMDEYPDLHKRLKEGKSDCPLYRQRLRLAESVRVAKPLSTGLCERLKVAGCNLFSRFSTLHPTNENKHQPEYIQAVLFHASLMEAAAGSGVDAESEKSPEDIQDFVKHFLDKPSDFSTTPAGITALKFEAWMIENDAAAFKQLVEVIVDAKKPQFIAVFQGEIAETDWQALVAGVRSFVEIQKVVEAGDRSGDDAERSDVTVVECEQVKAPDSSDTSSLMGKKSDKSSEQFGAGWYEPRESVEEAEKHPTPEGWDKGEAGTKPAWEMTKDEFLMRPGGIMVGGLRGLSTTPRPDVEVAKDKAEAAYEVLKKNGIAHFVEYHGQVQHASKAKQKLYDKYKEAANNHARVRRDSRESVQTELHRKSIERALQNGKIVPPEVLKDHPGINEGVVKKTINRIQHHFGGKGKLAAALAIRPQSADSPHVAYAGTSIRPGLRAHNPRKMLSWPSDAEKTPREYQSMPHSERRRFNKVKGVQTYVRMESLVDLAERNIEPEELEADRMVMEGLIVLDVDKFLLTSKGKEVLKQFKEEQIETELACGLELSPPMEEAFRKICTDANKYVDHFAESGIKGMRYVGSDRVGEGVQQFRWVNETGEDYMTLTVVESPKGYRTESAWFGMPRPALVHRFAGTLDEIAGPSTLFPPDALKRCVEDTGYMSSPVNLSSRFGTWSIQPDVDGNAQIAVGGDDAKRVKVDTSFVSLQERLDSLLAESESTEEFDKQVEELLTEMTESTGESVPHLAGVDGVMELKNHYEKYGKHKIEQLPGGQGFRVILPEQKRKHRYVADMTSKVTSKSKPFVFAGEGYHDEHSD